MSLAYEVDEKEIADEKKSENGFWTKVKEVLKKIWSVVKKVLCWIGGLCVALVVALIRYCFGKHKSDDNDSDDGLSDAEGVCAECGAGITSAQGTIAGVSEQLVDCESTVGGLEEQSHAAADVIRKYDIEAKTEPDA